MKTTIKEPLKTICMNCGTKYAKERFLFDYCPICKSRNLKELKQGGSNHAKQH